MIIYTSDNGPWNQDRYTKHKKGHPKDSIFWGDAGPLRNGKGSPFEGGYRLPCIVRWPERVPSGSVSDAIFSSIDFLPTFAKLTGEAIPKHRVIDGIDQTQLLLGKTEQGREHFYYERGGVRKGDWKFLKGDAYFYDYAVDPNYPNKDHLFNLKTDISEKENLAKQHPEILKELKVLYQQIEASVKKPYVTNKIKN